MFCDLVAAHRGRSLRLMDLPTGVGVSLPCGLWMSMDDEDVVVVDRRTSGYHQQQIILHELGHMLSGHRGRPGNGPVVDPALFPDLPAGTLQAILGRVHYGNVEEQEAEMIASLVLARALVQGDEPAEELPGLARGFGFGG
ncbi:hypothetical protein [Streptomyces kronopolitis]|uniref:hypothetical protein n=1 Tax=Streptomyces kronopolitis TaxID=1612435 RepID=UPI001664A5FF|nr:hypothetical protein [Streptomyces kronopolitis]